MKWKGFGSSAGQGETTLIAPGAVIDGTITFTGILEIEGRVNGNIFAAGDEQAVVRILQGGHVHGNVSAPLIVVNGTVAGNVHSTDRKARKSTAGCCSTMGRRDPARMPVSRRSRWMTIWNRHNS